MTGQSILINVNHEDSNAHNSRRRIVVVLIIGGETISSHPLEAVLVRDEPTAKQQQILEESLKQVLTKAGLVSHERYSEVVPIMKSLDQALRDMRVMLQHAKETWRVNARSVYRRHLCPDFCIRKIVAVSMLA